MSSAQNAERYLAIRRTSIVGASVNFALAVVKLIFGFIAQSQSLIADGIHSFSDLATDALVVYAAKHSNKGADEDHPYGHARIETAYTVGLGLFLIAVAVGIMWDAGHRLLEPALLLHPQPLALIVAAFSILANEGLYHYTMRIAKQVRSPLLHANAWHHRSDAISSVVVLIGITGALLGLDYLDAFASAGVALMIAKIGWDLAWNAIRELVDTGLEPERLAQVRKSITQVEGVKDFHMLRTRSMGGEALVDVHVQVNPRLSVSEGHQIGEYVRAHLTEGIDEISDVTVHIDPEDDESNALCEGLPLRREIFSRLRERWYPLLDTTVIQGMNLHYLSGKVDIELIIPLSHVNDIEHAQSLAQCLRQKAQDLKEIGSIQIYFSMAH